MIVFKEVADLQHAVSRTNLQLAKVLDELNAITSDRVDRSPSDDSGTKSKSKRLDTIESKIASGEDTLKMLMERKQGIESTIEIMTPMLHQILRVLIGNNSTLPPLATGEKHEFDITALQSLGTQLYFFLQSPPL
jgi:hypothetical protein